MTGRNVFWSTVIGLGCCIFAGHYVLSQDKSQPKSVARIGPSKSKPTSLLGNRQLVHILVEPGSENEARAYYTAIEAELNVDLGDFSPGGTDRSTIDTLLRYVGHQRNDGTGVKANDLEIADSDVLMDLTKLKAFFTSTGRPPEEVVSFNPGDVAVTRWFSPKITDVAVPNDLINNFGWRKLVRLKPLAGSEAANKKVAGMYVLFNVFSTRDQLTTGSPFAQRSLNNQVILTKTSDSTLSQSAYFLVFGEIKQDVPKSGEIIFALNASFDFRHPTTAPPGAAYFVPRACAQCHGAELESQKGKLNFLDTDHWFDRVQSNDDFGFITTTTHGVLFDGGKDQSSAKFAEAFAVIRGLNVEIEQQNSAVDADREGFALRTVRNWLALHASRVSHVGIVEDANGDGFLDRSIRGDAGFPGENDRWRKNDRVDESLLPLLNRYCYRCHSSVRYSIYDRSIVRFNSGETLQRKMQKLLTEIPTGPPLQSVPFMPQDRFLLAPERNRLVGLLDRLIDG